METMLKSIVTLTVTINCSYKTAFDYIKNPINQKEWAIHFFKDIEEVDGKFIATLPLGQLPMEIKSDYEIGILDIYLGNSKPIRTRLINIEDNLNIYNFTLAQPKEMPNDVWENKALPDMKDELHRLKSILENK